MQLTVRRDQGVARCGVGDAGAGGGWAGASEGFGWDGWSTRAK